MYRLIDVYTHYMCIYIYIYMCQGLEDSSQTRTSGNRPLARRLGRRGEIILMFMIMLLMIMIIMTVNYVRI